jgi:hypothetical protein
VIRSAEKGKEIVGFYLVTDVLHTGPAAEDKGVVGGDDGDGVDALGLDLVVLFEVGREMVGVARGLRVGMS